LFRLKVSNIHELSDFGQKFKEQKHIQSNGDASQYSNGNLLFRIIIWDNHHQNVKNNFEGQVKSGEHFHLLQGIVNNSFALANILLVNGLQPVHHDKEY
jgi:hypothetical protein